MKKYNNRLKQSELSQSLSIPSLMTLDPDELNANWFEVERVIAHDNELEEYLVKWRGLGYDQVTWEKEGDIKDKSAVQKYYERLKHSNKVKIDSPRNVDPKSFKELPDPFKDEDGNQLRDYQVEGFNWLRYCWYNGINSILADEMGLGKTLQIVATLSDIADNHGIRGPFLVIAPLSTLPHWKNEFERWSKLNAVIFHGNSQAREIIQRYEMFVYNSEGQRLFDLLQFDVLITNYETFYLDFEIFEAIQWRYLVLDEGHRLKNHTGKCYKLLQQIHFEHCTLLTGTPVQNNVEELWSLLHFLHPNRFGDLPTFLEHFGVIEDAEKIKKLQDLIKPYLLRRRKKDVDHTIAAKEETIIEVELTRVQKTYYRALLHENAGVLLHQITGGALPSLLNLMMQLRKVCNHPFLLKGAMKHIEQQTAEKLQKTIKDEEVQLKSIVESSGKLILIDKLLPKLRADGHKVLIFSQMVKVLDILEDYLDLINIKPERIDGTVPENERQNAIERFASDPNAFVFLLCTRAGGVGINLTAADTVIIYDSDWNPQNDLQAESRCHRIGQTSKVKVYRLVTRGTYELEMLDKASKKLGLDHAILDGGEINPKQRPMAAKEVEKLLRRGVYDIANDDDTAINNFCAADIDQILETNSQLYKTGYDFEGESHFSKAKFNVDADQLDMNSKDFWAKALPEIKLEKEEEQLTERRCKKKNVKFNDLSDDDDDHRKRKKISSLSSLTPRALAFRIMHQGYNGSTIEKALVLHVLKTEQVTPENAEILKKILDVKSFDEISTDIINAERKFSTPLKDYVEKKDTLIKRIIFFYQLNQVLSYLQGDIDSWPVTSSGMDPMIEYAILFGLQKNGVGQASKVLEGISLNGQSPSFNDKSLQKITKQLISEFINEAKTIDKFPKSYLDPKEWREDHMNIFNRIEMTDSEFVSLFQTVAILGFPIKKEKHVEENIINKEDNKEAIEVIDWEQLRTYSSLTCISFETFQENGIILFDLAKDKFDSSNLKTIIQRLGPYGNKVWMAKFRVNVHDLGQIRSFVTRSSSDKGENARNKIKEKAIEWDIAPDWWDSTYDYAMLQALAQYGLAMVSTWIIDQELPFLEKVDLKFIDDFCKSSEIEKSKFRPQKPKNAGDFSFIYPDKARMMRANYILSIIDEKYTKFKIDDSNISDDIDLYANEFTELPQMPLELGNALTIIDLGHFESATSSFPIGFKCQRQYFSIKNPTEKSWYEGSTELNEKGEIKYAVKHMSTPEKIFTSHTSSGVWEQVIQEVQKARGKVGLQKRKHTTVSGPFMFGFSNATVTGCFRLMKSLKEAEKEGNAYQS